MADKPINYAFGKGAHEARNLALHEEYLAARAQVLESRSARIPPQCQAYPLNQLSAAIEFALTRAGIDGTPALASLGRERFDSDYCVTIPAQLKAVGNRGYITQVVPKIDAAISASDLVSDGTVVRVETKGMYVNLKLSDRWLTQSLAAGFELGERFGESASLSGKAVVVDYSSPNAAKHLHAGHIRSTIIGEVIANLYDTIGATVHRINHINDLGGFGYLLEGWRRWEPFLPPGEPGDRLAALYGIFRQLEKIFDEKKEIVVLPKEDRLLVEKCFPDTCNFEAFAAVWNEYVAASRKRYETLEDGGVEEFPLWEQMIRWSLADFQKFYNVLGIKFGYTIGESFYAANGATLVADALKSGKTLVFTPAEAARTKAELDRELARKEIAEKEHASITQAVDADVNAVVLPLGTHDRVVLRRSDGRTIYATRDIGAIDYRVRMFAPMKIIYEVGQEQKEHFAHVFAGSRALGVDGGAELEHIYHGFYVDAQTKKKLSSRQGASNVHQLLAETIKHFEARYDKEQDLSQEEIKRTAQQLAVGSIIINDIKKDKKNNVELHGEIDKAIQDFEQAGGAYLLYSACRARGILRKHGRALPDARTLGSEPLEIVEAELVKKLLDFPNKVRLAAEKEDPSQLVTFLFETAFLYNSYYHSIPVIKGGTVFPHRLVLTGAVQRLLENGLRMCHVECPEWI